MRYKVWRSNKANLLWGKLCAPSSPRLTCACIQQVAVFSFGIGIHLSRRMLRKDCMSKDESAEERAARLKFEGSLREGGRGC